MTAIPEVSFKQIMTNLHRSAKEQAEKIAGNNFRVFNTAFDQKTDEFISSGSWSLFVTLTQEEQDKIKKQLEAGDDTPKPPEPEKRPEPGTEGATGSETVSESDEFISISEADETPDSYVVSQKGLIYKVMQEYFKWFIGEEDTNNYLKDNFMQPVRLSTMNQTKPEPDAKKEPDAKPETGTSAPEPVSESITASIEHDLLEADATGTEPTPPVGSEETKDPETKEPDKKEEPDNQNVDILIGYGVFYDIEVNNKKASSWTDALKTKAKGLLGGMYSDLLSWKIRWRGSNLHVGKLLDPKFYKSNVLGIQEIDKAQVGNLVQDAFKGEFNTGVVAKGMSNEEVENILNKYGKLTNKIRNQMRHEGENCVVIELDRGDNAYKTDPKQMAELVARKCTEAFGTVFQGVNWNKVKANQVIRVDAASLDDTYQHILHARRRDRLDDVDSQGRQVKDTSKVNEDDDLGVNFGFLIDDDVELMEDYSDVTLGISPYKNDDRDMTSDPYSSGKYTKDLEQTLQSLTDKNLPSYHLEYGKDYGLLSTDQYFETFGKDIEAHTIKEVPKTSLNVIFFDVRQDMSTLTFESNNNSISRTQVYNMILESFGLYEEQVSEGLESDKQKKFDAKKKEVQDEITSAVKNIIKNSVDEVLDKYYDQFPSYIKNIDMKMSVGESLNEDSSGDDDVDTGVTIRVHMAAPDPFVMLGKDGKPMPPPPARTGGLHDRIKLEDKVLFIVPHKQIKDKGVKNKIEQDKYGRSRATRDTSNYKRNQI